MLTKARRKSQEPSHMGMQLGMVLSLIGIKIPTLRKGRPKTRLENLTGLWIPASCSLKPTPRNMVIGLMNVVG
ncbi:4-hydroxy-3-polyprenylbenzoate decarboxylase [Sesbania bispinosa]|nr:4-hydroxy-3-polyprenylbenzoate decarboxylase [Sesbania bispinosa]